MTTHGQIARVLAVFPLSFLLAAPAAYAQGTFAFNNRVPPDIVAPIEVCGAFGLVKPEGDAYTWQLIGGPTGISRSAAQPLTSGSFRTGNAAGFVNPPASAIVVPGVPDGARADVWIQIFEGATVTGSPGDIFGPFTVMLTVPPATPNNLPLGTNPIMDLPLGGSVCAPEPGTLPLGLIGLASLLLVRRARTNAAA